MPRDKILLVDDSEPDRLLFERLIRKHMPECGLVMAESAEEGMARALEDPPDCAILDVYMPGMEGIELCEYFKGNEATAHFPILLITGAETDSELRVRGLEAGADDFIQRPCEDIDLVAKIRVMLRIKRVEEELRNVNKRLASLAGERSRDLHESDERFRLIFNAVRDGILILELDEDDQPGAILDVNDVASKLTGYPRDEILRLNLKELVSPNRVEALSARIESIVSLNQVYFDTELLAHDGHRFAVSAHARLFKADGRHTIVFVFNPIEGARDTQEPARDGYAGYRTLVTETGQLIYDVTLHDSKAKLGGEVAWITGMTADEITGFTFNDWQELIHEDDFMRVQAAFQKAIASVGKYQIEYRVRHADGGHRTVEDLGVVLPGEDGTAYRLLGSVKDISARVRAEKELRRIEREVQHSQKLESLGVLAGGIAHDFNNILAAIIGLTDMAMQDIPKDSETYEDLKEVLQAGHRAKELVKQILTFSRQTGEERKPFFLHIVIREALKLLRATLPPAIEIIDSVDVHSGIVEANATQMHQVIMNYCTNAYQAMEDGGGKLEVRLIDLEVDEKLAKTNPKLHPGPYLKLSVQDNGHGMEAAMLQRIFDPFFSTKGPGEGTGMGLSVVHGIVSDHGGAIIVESKPGRGAAFHTYLPRLTEANVEEAPQQRGAPRGHERILFVDDEVSVQRFVESALSRLGYQVTLCSNGIDALKLAKNNPEAIDLLITDQSMPKMTGDALARAVKKIRPDLPIILFTGFSNILTETEAKKAGIQEIVMKPIIATDLAHAVRRVIDQNAASKPPS